MNTDETVSCTGCLSVILLILILGVLAGWWSL